MTCMGSIASSSCGLLLSLLNQPICAIACEPNVVKVPVECTRKAMKSPPAATPDAGASCMMKKKMKREEKEEEGSTFFNPQSLKQSLSSSPAGPRRHTRAESDVSVA